MIITHFAYNLPTFLHLLLALLPEIISGQDAPGKAIDYSKLDLNEELLRGSRWSVEQGKKSKMIQVYHSIEVVDISKVDVDTMSVRIEIHFQQRWEAEDMQFPVGLFKNGDSKDTFIQADPKILESLWSPDSYIPMARIADIASFTNDQAVVGIFRNKTIIYKARLYVVLGCMFDFSWYPLDKQMCSLTIESYTTADNLVQYLWEINQSPVIYTNLKLLQYDIRLPMTYSNGSNPRWGRAAKYPYIQLDFSFERQLGHHMIQVFIPTTLVVILSWFSFWLGLDAIPGRISLLITCMLTLVTMHSGLKGAIPPVNYIKMMDIWMVGCMAFVFLALCEFIVVKYLHWRKQIELKALEEKEQAIKLYMDKVKMINERVNKDGTKSMNNLDLYRNMGMQDGIARQAWVIPGPNPGTLLPLSSLVGVGDEFSGFPPHPNNLKPQKRNIWVTIDLVFRALYPLSFIAFNAAFWPWLIIGANSQ